MHPEIQWAKLAALAEVARLASRELWGADGRGEAPAAAVMTFTEEEKT
ncbi:MAG: hypothetical protein JO363_19855 [Solirubrobacterales bacterium]|nr:hypothetical protein [Solirubrobacterales bacterium]